METDRRARNTRGQEMTNKKPTNTIKSETFLEMVKRIGASPIKGLSKKPEGGNIAIQPGQGGAKPSLFDIGACEECGSEYMLADGKCDICGSTSSKDLRADQDRNGETDTMARKNEFGEPISAYKPIRIGKIGGPRTRPVYPYTPPKMKNPFLQELEQPGSSMAERVEALEVEGAEVDKELGQLAKTIQEGFDKLLLKLEVMEQRIKALEESK